MPFRERCPVQERIAMFWITTRGFTRSKRSPSQRVFEVTIRCLKQGANNRLHDRGANTVAQQSDMITARTVGELETCGQSHRAP